MMLIITSTAGDFSYYLLLNFSEGIPTSMNLNDLEIEKADF